ncbi:succinate dehydrogenase assembly factor 4, mitochondrial isoform X2 [Cinclus cinclus]|uniref:succinate dehydrogenase assembly factor 4, mitochondrial isoform X2 n=1 Tax=Cinclus cinclus TaxID=127875 RepID=UPI002E165043
MAAAGEVLFRGALDSHSVTWCETPTFMLHVSVCSIESSLLCHLRSSSSSKPGGRSEPAKQPLKKPKLPVGRFDETEESSMEKEPLEKFPDGINPTTKERGGPRGPEPTRFGDWERKGRCIDF